MKLTEEKIISCVIFFLTIFNKFIFCKNIEENLIQEKTVFEKINCDEIKEQTIHNLLLNFTLETKNPIVLKDNKNEYFWDNKTIEIIEINKIMIETNRTNMNQLNKTKTAIEEIGVNIDKGLNLRNQVNINNKLFLQMITVDKYEDNNLNITRKDNEFSFGNFKDIDLQNVLIGKIDNKISYSLKRFILILILIFTGLVLLALVVYLDHDRKQELKNYDGEIRYTLLE